MDTTYKYNRIDLATDAIRLVTLLKGDQSQQIQCEIFETYLHQVEGVPYEALSYVWGTEVSAKPILLDGCVFGVTHNLYEALIHLRRQDEDRVLWVDAICIDQSHNAERGHQVGQMRLVYQTAERVVIWLGASNHHIDNLFVWMKTLDQHVLTMARPHTLSTWEDQWSQLVWQTFGTPPSVYIHDALGELLQREWFSRVWVVQEAALAKSAMITCGHNEVNSRTFVVMPSILNVVCVQNTQARLDILPGLLRGKSTLSGTSGKNLMALLEKFGRSKASDPRDIIYALLGLSEDAHSSQFLRPNYQVSVHEAIRKAVAYLMMQTHDLLMETPIQSLPTWSIDKFLDSLKDLPVSVFRWATENAQDVLIYDLIIAQSQKYDNERMQKYMKCEGVHGPPITVALKRGNFALIDLLLTIPGTNVEMRDSAGKTPLSLAVEQGNIAVARSILQYQRQISHKKLLGHNTATLVAASQGSSILGERFSGSPRFVQGSMALLVAIKQGDRAAVESILSSNLHVDMSMADENGDGLLNIAARIGDEHIIDLLLESEDNRHVSLGFRGSDGLTPLESAVVGGFQGVIRKLLPYNRGAVHDAVASNQVNFLLELLDAEPLMLDGYWLDFQNPLGMAAEVGNTNIVSLLLDKGADINSRDPDERAATPLWIAAAYGHLDTVMLLIERGADVELVANDTWAKTTALWAAAARGHEAVVMYLLKSGAKVQDAAASTPNDLKYLPGGDELLWVATRGGHTGVVRALIERGVDPGFLGPSFPGQVPDSEVASGRLWATPIWVAASLGYADIVGLFAEHGVDIEARDCYYGMTPYMRAAQLNLLDTMEVLIKYGANISAKPL